MNIQVPILNAFVDGNEGGNPAGVVLDAGRFSRAQKQHIAAALGLSETAFVSESTTADFKLEFFTPNKQIPHCGHATIATFSYLAQQGLVRAAQTSKETIDGNRAIFMEGEMAFMEQIAPKYTELAAAEVAQVEAVLNLSGDEWLEGARPLIVNTGVSFLLVPVRDMATLRAIEPDLELVNGLSETHDLIGFHLFTLETAKPGRLASGRMFAPRYGIAEESATGMANGPLGCYLYDVLGITQTEMVLEQGVAMRPPSPSELTVRLDVADGHIVKLLVGGKAAVSQTMTVQLDAEVLQSR